jgi:hypothetical protein
MLRREPPSNKMEEQPWYKASQRWQPKSVGCYNPTRDGSMGGLGGALVPPKLQEKKSFKVGGALVPPKLKKKKKKKKKSYFFAKWSLPKICLAFSPSLN